VWPRENRNKSTKSILCRESKNHKQNTAFAVVINVVFCQNETNLFSRLSITSTVLKHEKSNKNPPKNVETSFLVYGELTLGLRHV